MTDKKRLLSGVKPTGRPHIGNYLGAMKQFVNLEDSHESFFMIANYHALTTLHNSDELKENTIDVALDYLAIGLDPEKSVIFMQSQVPEHTELAWIFNCITTMPYLMRAHAFKDAEAKNKEVSVGTFDYPMLMATDILIYDPDIVPVGQDQKQHVEFARDTASKFNRIFGETFKLPEVQIQEEVAVVPGIDGQKMSKSYNNTISLFASDDELRSSVMNIVTDSKGEGESKDPETSNLFTLHKHFSGDKLQDLEKRYRDGSIGYKESKEILYEDIKSIVAPLRERRENLKNDIGSVHSILKNGGEKAREYASKKMDEVRKKVGVSLE
jgi:tryptophanyl-tRNA synthetase|tara:strand:+ start:64566 stop:65543 length:978 start_codon:yes stop_codon:yes gene_type:complete